MNEKRKSIFNAWISALILICLLISSSVCNVYAGTLAGDVNNDGVLTYKDVKAMSKYVRNREFNGVDKYDFSNADMDGDNVVTATDVAKVFSQADLSDKAQATNLFILGDSTGCDYAPTADETYYYKRVGFGTRIGDYFEDNVTVVNLAISGRSSKSFTTEQYYQDYLNKVSKGDYVIIAFGHNDEKAEDARYTNPNGGKDVEGSFQNSLYVNYIKPALEKGATPILATPIVRRTTTTEWSNSNLHITADATANGKTYEGGDYPQAIRDLAKELNLYVIDNTELTKALYEKLTPDETIYLHAWTSSSKNSFDATHLNNFGAAYISYLMVNDLKGSNVELGESVIDDIKAPEKDANLIVNPDYKEADPNEELVADGLWKTTSPWIGTVYGNVGSSPILKNADTGEFESMNTEFFNIQENEDGSVNTRMGKPDSGSAKGKIASSNDGVAMYFQKLSVSTNFELTATATINGFNNSGNNQAAFGIMVTDTLGMNKNDTGVCFNNYVVAGALGTKSYVPNFARIEKTLTNSENVITDEADQPKAGTKVYLKVVKVGNKVTATYTTETGKEYKDEFAFNPTTGASTIYAGVFATRCTDVTYSDIRFNNEVSE